MPILINFFCRNASKTDHKNPWKHKLSAIFYPGFHYCNRTEIFWNISLILCKYFCNIWWCNLIVTKTILSHIINYNLKQRERKSPKKHCNTYVWFSYYNSERWLKNFSGGVNMGCFGGFGGNDSCLWIILLLIIVCCCCGDNNNARLGGSCNDCCCDWYLNTALPERRC